MFIALKIFFGQLIQNQLVATSIFATAMILLAAVAGGYEPAKLRLSSEAMPKVGSRIRFLLLTIGILCLSVVTTPKVMVLYIALLTYLAIKEFMSITPTRRADRRVLFWVYLVVPIQFCFIWIGWYRAFLIFVPLYLLLVIPLIMVTIGETDGFIQANGTLIWITLTAIYGLGHLAYLLHLNHAAVSISLLPASTTSLPPLLTTWLSTLSLSGSLALFLYFALLAEWSYVTQFVCGRLINHPKLRLPTSTTRNWASLVGSALLTSGLAWLLAGFLTPLSNQQALTAGMVVALGSFVGYMVLAAVKNDLQLTDRGTMTPGRGGVLNRIYTWAYSAPLFFHLVSHLP